MKIHTLDLHFLGHSETIAAFLIETTEGPVLVESGPYSTFGQLTEALGRHGYQPSDIGHVFLTHIHLDHAGAAWAFENAKIYVHPFGYPHLNDPSKLLESARRIYKEDMDRLWSELRPIPAERMVAVEHEQSFQIGDLKIQAWHTPGHAYHHIAWQAGGTLFTGDVAGVKIGSGPVVAPCPPPDIDLPKWKDSLQLIARLAPEQLRLTHYGQINGPEIAAHLAALETNLDMNAEWIRQHMTTEPDVAALTRAFDEFSVVALQERGVEGEGIAQYQSANPAWMSVAGLMRYWKKTLENKK